MSDLKETVVVLDLDDTLYKEADYRASGLAAVCARLETLFGKSFRVVLNNLQDSGESDLLAGLCRVAGLPLSVKDSLLWVYRLHEPRIQLSTSTQAVVTRLQEKCRVAILTDGRSISQRMKLKALGISHLPAYISEDYASDKPSPLRFELIMRDMPAQAYYYVGDNPRKDFIAPNTLDWVSIGLRDDGRNIHKQDLTGLAAEQLPSHWVDSLEEILTHIC